MYKCMDLYSCLMVSLFAVLWFTSLWGTQAQANEANEAATKATQVKAKTTSRAPRHHSPSKRNSTVPVENENEFYRSGLPGTCGLHLLCNGIRPGNQGLQYTLLTPWHESAPSRHETSKASEPTEVEGPYRQDIPVRYSR